MPDGMELRLSGIMSRRESTLDIWVPVNGKPGHPQHCFACTEPMLGTRYVHRHRNDRLFCSAVCVMLHYLDLTKVCTNDVG